MTVRGRRAGSVRAHDGEGAEGGDGWGHVRVGSVRLLLLFLLLLECPDREEAGVGEIHARWEIRACSSCSSRSSCSSSALPFHPLLLLTTPSISPPPPPCRRPSSPSRAAWPLLPASGPRAWRRQWRRGWRRETPWGCWGQAAPPAAAGWTWRACWSSPRMTRWRARCCRRRGRRAAEGSAAAEEEEEAEEDGG